MPREGEGGLEEEETYMQDQTLQANRAQWTL